MEFRTGRSIARRDVNHITSEKPHRILTILRANAAALFLSDLVAFVLASALVPTGSTGTLAQVWQVRAEHILTLDPSWHGWGTLLVLTILLANLWGKAHYTQRVPFWTEFGDILRVVVVALLCDFFITTALYRGAFPAHAALRWFLFIPVLMAMRQAVRMILNRMGLWELRTLVAGDGSAVESVTAALQSERALGYRVVGATSLKELPVAPSALSWAELRNRWHADFVAIVLSGNDHALDRSAIASIARSGVPFALVPSLEGVPVLGARPHYFFSHDVMFLPAGNSLARPLSRAVKLSFDVAGAAALLVLLAPLLLAMAWRIRRDGGPALFRHRRVGMNGQHFDCIKFRTMFANSAGMLRELLDSDPEARAEWEATQKLRNDPRVTPVGHFLRATSLDELPQLFNVLRGEMSLVGPRPIVDAEVAHYGEDFYFYQETRPGMTGLWQVSGRSDTTYAQRVRLDTWYVRNWTLWHDIAILLKTIPAVLFRRGAL